MGVIAVYLVLGTRLEGLEDFDEGAFVGFWFSSRVQNGALQV